MYIPKSNKITKAIIAAAGNGTRMSPLTQSIPKELIPIIDKPILQGIIEQCIAADIREIIIIVKDEKSMIIEFVKKVFGMKQSKIGKSKIEFIIQNELLPYGNARPLFTIRDLIKPEERFVYTWGDVLIWGEDCGIKEVLKEYENDTKVHGILTTFKVNDTEIKEKAAIKLKDNSNIIEDIIEKPKLEEKPSNFGTTAPFILSGRIFEYMDPEKLNPLKNEFVLQDSIRRMLKEGIKFKACFSKGIYLSNGDITNYIKSTLKLGMHYRDLDKRGLEFLDKKISELGI
jgi:UTP--glucose-1-phosphate uridylyltransferase